MTSGRAVSVAGWIAFAMMTLLVAPRASAQEFEPRTYSATPVGLNFVAVGYVYVSGAVLMDPALPADDVDGQVHVAVARYIRTFALLGKPAKAKIVLPWSSGHWDGFYEGEPRLRDTAGFGDMRFVLESQFYGVEAKSPAEMRGYTPRAVGGARLQVVAPTGHYESDRAINIGGNRWVFIPEIGVGVPLGKWSLEGALAGWIFTPNDDFAGGNRLEQNALLVAKVHVVRSIRPGFWWAIAAGYGYGGQTQVNSEPRATTQRNWRLYAVLAYPTAQNQGVVLTAGTGGNAGVGSDTDLIGIGYQFAW